MKVISIISQKGGTGKTTLALNLAVAAEITGHTTIIIDIDPQASAKEWSKTRENNSPVVISAYASQLNDILNTAKDNDVSLVFIDTAPHSEKDALLSARVADLILIPCRPAILDLFAISSTKDIAFLAHTPALAVINSSPPRGKLAKEAEEVIKGYDLEVAPMVISQRAAFVHSLTVGKTVLEYEPKGKAAEEIKMLFEFVYNHIENIDKS